MDLLAQDWPSELTGPIADLGELMVRWRAVDGQRFLIRSDGVVDLRVNAFLSSARMRTLASNTNRDYAQSLCLWLNFLEARGCVWSDATEDDVDDFEFWRRTDPNNPVPVGASTFSKDVAACKKFYSWAAERFADVADIFLYVDPPPSKRSARVRWLDPAAVDRWRDVGLRGRDLRGRRDRSCRTRNEQRDMAFFDGLYGTGLRLSEWASVTIDEIPTLGAGRPFYKCHLADKCAKGGYGHPFWMPRNVLAGICAYVEGARARAVRGAQDSSRYAELSDAIVVGATKRPGSVRLPDGNGGFTDRAWNTTGPALRRRLFRRTQGGLEPIWLWLNENGLPRDPHGWHHTFAEANDRIAAKGLENFTCTPHMLRHSFALRWFSVGKLVYSSRLAHLSDEEARDFRVQFGDTWHLVQTMLGHRRVETTRNVYLEPFRSLDVEVLLAQTQGLPVSGLLAELFDSHSMVLGDPVARR
ncbi:site-specific integrase [Mycobacterium sp. ST-F2]|uniref:tyrosine-type recombinase/integrase n=1 Tax=Mycobacterium sp. ST-F2 TaxID=1490484 RepID=UPI0025708812|nr:site-specific integrase [Mycobacterium sp. ST-F2]